MLCSLLNRPRHGQWAARFGVVMGSETGGVGQSFPVGLAVCAPWTVHS